MIICQRAYILSLDNHEFGYHPLMHNSKMTMDIEHKNSGAFGISIIIIGSFTVVLAHILLSHYWPSSGFLRNFW